MNIRQSVYLLPVAALLALGACQSKPTNTAATQEEELPLVDIETVSIQSVPQTAEYTATVQGFKTNNITSSAAARIKEIKVDVGAHVKAGQPLVILDDVNIAQTKVRLDDAERELQRARELLEIGAGTRQSVDRLQTERDALRRQYDNLVENTTLVSPIAGVVTARNYDAGDLPGQLPILTIEQVQPVKIIVNISETDFAKVHVGMNADVTLDVYPGEHFEGKVYLIHPTVDAASRTFTVEITLPNTNGRILPGMFARVALNFGEADHVVVPDRAVVKQTGSGNKYVYVYHPDNGTVSYDRVEVGQRLGSSYEVLSGVPDGAWVVITGQVRLADGMKVDARRPGEVAPEQADSTAAE